MKWSKAISTKNPRSQEIEFSLLLGWALLYPDKFAHAYFLGFMCLLSVFIVSRIFALKNVALTRFSSLLFLFNAVLLFNAFFSPHAYKSLLHFADVFLVSLWFMLLYLEEEDLERFLRSAALVISLSSLGVVILFALQGGGGPVTPFFANPIFQGIASALGAMVFLHALLRKYGHADLLLLALNAGAVIISASKAAFLGLALLAAIMIFRGRRRWLVIFFALLLLLVLAPNPLRRMVGHSLRHDPYVLNRLDIWSMSARMFRAHPWTGIGPDLFAETAPRFNFPQEKGPARYFKVPESPHSDYWKVIVENGVPGLILVMLFLFFAIRRLFWPSALSGWLLAFLLAQMLLFNFVFHYFFFSVFLLLLKDFFSAGRRFVAVRPGLRIFVSGLVAFALLVLYLLPFVADRCLDRAARENDIIRRFGLLKRAALLSPLDARPALEKASLLRAFAARRSDRALPAAVEESAWADALDNVRQARRLNGNGIAALLLEAELFMDLRRPAKGYPALCDEVLAPLRRAEAIAPFNPFLKLRQAAVLQAFGRSAAASERARAALDLEPDFAAALVFLQRLDGSPADVPALNSRLAAIREKAEKLRARPGSYLFELHRIPEAEPGERKP